MSTSTLPPANPLFGSSHSLNQRLSQLHERLLAIVPCVDRIACAVYDEVEDLLKTFVSSTRHGEPLTAYQVKLSSSHALHELARSGSWRVIDDIPATLTHDSPHTRWVREQGYQSSLTVPLYDNAAFIGMLFFDSCRPAAFTAQVQRDLVLYSNLINMTLSSELAAVRSITATAHIARDISHLRDFETGAHLERMARLSRLIARHVAPIHHLSDEFVEQVFLFAPLHDIGKIGIPDSLLLKPGKLDADEYRLMQTHVGKGTEIIDRIIGHFALQQLPGSIIMKNIVQHHHELLDGSGYPLGLRGDAIPIEARIVTVADIFDALTSARPYKPAWPVDQALAELDRMVAAGRLDIDCVAALHRGAADALAIIERHQDIKPPA